MKRIWILLLVSLATSYALACTNFLVGKNASIDGSTYISYAADSYALYGFLHFSPAADYEEGAVREIVDWDTGKPLGSIPQVRHTYSVVGNMNEHQVTIGETTWGGVETMWDTAGIDYGSLIYIALERSKTAREAIACVTSLVEQYGYASEGESFSFGDPNEIWIMDLIGCGKGSKKAVWVATRIPDDCIAAHANQARIQRLPLAGAKRKGYIVTSKDGQWMWHKDVIKVAREKGLFAGKDEEFSFQAAYNPYDFSGLYVCEARVWSFFRHFSDDMDRYFDYASGRTFLLTNGKDAGEPMPLYIRPNRKVSVQDVRACMRDQYENTPLDITKGTDAGPWNSKLRYGSLTFEKDGVKYWYERPTATQQTGWSFVAQMRGWANPKVGGIFWFGVDDAATSLYMPMYCRIQSVPLCFQEGNGDLYTFSPTSAWWTFNIVANWAYPKYSRIYPEIQRVQQTWEDKFDTQVPGVDAQAAEMDEETAREFLTNYSCSQAENAVAAWQELGTFLMVKYLDGQERKEENGVFKRNDYGEPVGPNRPAFPDEFLEKIKDEIAHE